MTCDEEKRNHERHVLAIPCILAESDDNVASCLTEHRLQNISAGGAFINSVGETRIGASVRLEIVIPPNFINCCEGEGTHISADGIVVRTEKRGVAIAFRSDYRISSLGKVLRFLDKKRAWLARQQEAGLKVIQTDTLSSSEKSPEENRMRKKPQHLKTPEGSESPREKGTPDWLLDMAEA